MPPATRDRAFRRELFPAGRRMVMRSWTYLAGALALLAGGCSGAEADQQPTDQAATPAESTAPPPACDAGNGGIQLPPGFCALVVADSVGAARHIAVAPNGDLYIATQGKRGAETPAERGGVVGLRDTNGDGKADQRVFFGPEGGTGMAIQNGYLYFATNKAVV